MRKTSLFLAIISTVAVSLAVIVWLGTVTVPTMSPIFCFSRVIFL
jgi:hypothetical protein